jgi:hypothetical protein
MTRVLAFDIGIKNLAWCCVEKDGDKLRILGWDNYNLLSDESNVGAATKGGSCVHCKSKAAYTTVTSQQLVCSRHCPPAQPALRDCSGNLLKKLPNADECKQILQSRGLTKVPTKKAALEEELAKLYSLPIVVKKVSKAPDAGLITIHDSLRKLVQEQSPLWKTCSEILLENQPAFKNPTMKSVQILLFATLRDLLQPSPPMLKLVHAGKKVKGAEKGDAGYKDRKAGSEARAEAFLQDPKHAETAARWKPVWTQAKKKSDLADALAMCLDVHA